MSLHPANILVNPMGIYVSASYTTSSYTFTASPPAQFGNADVALTCQLDTFTTNTSSPYYLTSSTDLSAASNIVSNAASLLDFSTSFWLQMQAVSE